jgi:uncharacterized hydrophobic protein (TIGR00271 family)
MERGGEVSVAQQLLPEVAEQAELTPSYLVLMALAGVLAAVALLSNSVPILIGAMIVAPAFPPLALVAFGVCAAQPRAAGRGLGVALLGFLVAVVCATATAWLMNVTEVIPEELNVASNPLLEERVRPGWWGLAAAFAGGVAGTLALAKSKTDTLVGTVAALALVPAGAAAGIALLSDAPRRALGGLLLLTMNMALVIAMGIAVLVVLNAHAQRQQARGTGGRARMSYTTPLLIAVGLVVAIVVLLALATGEGKIENDPPPRPQTTATG